MTKAGNFSDSLEAESSVLLDSEVTFSIAVLSFPMLISNALWSFSVRISKTPRTAAATRL